MDKPTKNLGLTLEQLQEAHEFNEQIRYWPLRDHPCQPHVGWIRACWERELGGKTVPVLMLTGKAGWVLASHCELV